MVKTLLVLKRLPSRSVKQVEDDVADEQCGESPRQHPVQLQMLIFGFDQGLAPLEGRLLSGAGRSVRAKRNIRGSRNRTSRDFVGYG